MMRPKSRYLLVESSLPVDGALVQQFEHQLYTALLRAIGELCYHEANPKIMKFLNERQLILKCSLLGYKNTILALSMIKRLDSMDIAFYTLKSSGTIKALLKMPSDGK